MNVNMHRLKVVSFDKALSEKDDILKSEQKQHSVHATELSPKEDRYTHTTELSQKAGRQGNVISQIPNILNSTKTEEKTVKTYDHTGLTSARKISFASINELIKARARGKLLKSFSSIKTFSLDDIRKTLINNVYGYKRRQKKLKTQSPKNIGPKKKDVRKRIESQDDIKVLYYSNRCTSPVKKIKSTANNRKYALRRSVSDIYGFGNANRVCKNTYLCFHTNRNTGLFPKPKKRRKNTASTPYTIHQVYPLCTNQPNHNSNWLRFQGDSISDHFNVVGFPKCSKLNVNEQQYGCKYKLRDQYAVAPTPSVAKTTCAHKTGGNTDERLSAAVLTEPRSKCVVPVHKRRTCNNAKKLKKALLPLRIPRDTVKMKCCSFIKILSYLIKYIILGLTIMVWSPCILAIAICWLLVYPLKPHHVLESKTQPCGATKYEKKNPFTCIMEWTAKTTRRIVSTIYDIHESFMTPECFDTDQNVPPPCQFAGINKKNPNTKWQPNPSKRYVLFYDSERGWLMKPLRSEGCEECKRSEVVQNLCFNRKSHPNKAVTFTGSIPDDDDNIGDKYSHTCNCPPNIKFKGSINECTQVTCPEYESQQSKRGRKATQKKSAGFCAFRPCQPITICRPAPGKKTCKFPTRNKPTRRSPEANYFKRPYRRLYPKPVVQSKAPVQYIKGPMPERKDEERKDEEPKDEEPKDEERKDEKPKVSMREKFAESGKSCARRLKAVIFEADSTWDNPEITCSNLYIHTLRKRPCFWVYDRCPAFYPTVLSCVRACSCCCYIFLLSLSICLWLPIFLCCYLLCSLVCGCCD